MLKRIFTGIFGILIILFILLYKSAALFPFLLIGVSLIALDEFFSAFGVERTPAFKVLSWFGGIAFYDNKFANYSLWILLVWYFIENRNNIKEFAKNLTILLFGEFYIPFLMSFLLFIRKIQPYGIYWIWLSINAAFSTDIFAYFGGTKFGKHKLCPKISPNKTIEGAILGILGALGIALIYCGLVSKFTEININFVRLSLMSVCASIMSEIGDLVGSFVKRKCGIKDFGTSLPGHGGFLDRLDSLVFAAPFVYFFLTQIGIF